jgi:hypothetical protein
VYMVGGYCYSLIEWVVVHEPVKSER